MMTETKVSVLVNKYNMSQNTPKQKSITPVCHALA